MICSKLMGFTGVLSLMKSEVSIKLDKISKLIHKLTPRQSGAPETKVKICFSCTCHTTDELLGKPHVSPRRLPQVSFERCLPPYSKARDTAASPAPAWLLEGSSVRSPGRHGWVGMQIDGSVLSVLGEDGAESIEPLATSKEGPNFEAQGPIFTRCWWYLISIDNFYYRRALRSHTQDKLCFPNWQRKHSACVPNEELFGTMKAMS